MPKLKDVTTDELTTMIESAQDVAGQAHDLMRRFNSTGTSAVVDPMQRASSCLSASRALADLASALLMRAALQEQERTLRDKYAELAKGKKAAGEKRDAKV